MVLLRKKILAEYSSEG